MSDAGSDRPVNAEAAVAEVAEESDHRPTRFEYGDGGVPLYVGIIWVGFLLCYVAVMATVALPDLIAWVSS